MAPPKNKEKVIRINIGFPASRAKAIQKLAKSKKLTPTEYCRELICRELETAA